MIPNLLPPKIDGTNANKASTRKPGVIRVIAILDIQTEKRKAPKTPLIPVPPNSLEEIVPDMLSAVV